MTALRPPRGYKRGLSDLAAHNRAERAMQAPIGQRALREGWGRGLFQYVMDWGCEPTQHRTIEALKRAANDFAWELAEMREREPRDALEAAQLSLMERGAKAELDLQKRFLQEEVHADA